MFVIFVLLAAFVLHNIEVTFAFSLRTKPIISAVEGFAIPKEEAKLERVRRVIVQPRPKCHTKVTETEKKLFYKNKTKVIIIQMKVTECESLNRNRKVNRKISTE